MKTLYRAITTVTAAVALSISATGMASANAMPKISESNTLVTKTNESFESNPEALAFYELFSYYEKIPNSVLESGDEALAQWQKDNPMPKPRASFWGCVGSLAWLIGSNVVGAGKIIKIKKYIKELGGVWEAVKLIWGAGFSYEKMKAAGGALAGLGAEILGIKGVKDQCFS